MKERKDEKCLRYERPTGREKKGNEEERGMEQEREEESIQFVAIVFLFLYERAKTKATEEGHGKEAPTDYLLIKFTRNI